MVLTKAVYLNPYLYNFANLFINTRLCNYGNYSYSESSQWITLCLSKLLSNWYKFFSYFIDRIYVLTINPYYPLALFIYFHKLIQSKKLHKGNRLKGRQITPYYFVKGIRLDSSITLFIIYNKLRLYQTTFEFLQFTNISLFCHLLCLRINQSIEFAITKRIQHVKLSYILCFPLCFFFLIRWLNMILRKRHFRRSEIIKLKKQIITLKVFKEDVGNFHSLW